MFSRSVQVCLLACVAAFAAPQKSEAAYQLRIQYSTSEALFDFENNKLFLNGVDQGAIPASLATGNIRYSGYVVDASGNVQIGLRVGTFGAGLNPTTGYSFLATTSFSNTPGTSVVGQLDLSWQTAQSFGTPDSITLELTATGYTAPQSPVDFATRVENNTSVGSNLTGNINLSSTFSDLDTPFAPGTTLGTGTLNQVVLGQTDFFASGLEYVDTYTLTNKVTMQFSGSGFVTTGSITSLVVNSVPAPAAAYMAASVIPMIVVALRRRRKNADAALAA